MDNESLFAGNGMVDIRRRVKEGYANALSRYGNAYKLRQEQLAAQQAQLAQQEQAEPENAPPANPLMDPNGGFASYLQEQHGLTLDDVFNTGVSSIQREREFIMPYLEQKWRTENAPMAQQQGLTGSKLAQAREEYFRTGRAYGMADFSDRQAEIDTTGRVGSVLNAAGRGLAGLVDSASGLIKTAAGDDNVASEWLDAGTKTANNVLRDVNNPEQQELVDYMHNLASRGEYSKIAKLVVDYPFLAADQAVEQLSALGGYGKAVQGLGALAKAGKAADTARKGMGLGTIASYSGLQSAGGVAQELSRAGIDPHDAGAAMNVALAGLTSAAISAIAPATLEKTVISNFMGKGISEPTAKILAQETLAKIQSGGLFKTPMRYGMGLAKNTLKGAAGEGLEEYGQSGAEALAVASTNPDGTTNWGQGLTDADWENIERRAGSGAMLGAIIGGATKGATNTLSRYGDNEKSKLVADNTRYWNDAQTKGEFTAPENAVGKVEDLQAAASARKAELDAERTKAELDAERVKAEEDKTIIDGLKAKYGDFAETAKTDFDNIASQPTIDIDAAINAVVGKDGTPATVEEAHQQLQETTDPTARAALLKQWADATQDKAVQEVVHPIADEVSKFVMPNTAEADSTIADSISVATKRDVTTDNIDSAIDSFVKGNAHLENLASQYKQAKADGYTNTAKEIADKFQAEVNKQISSGKIKTESDTVEVAPEVAVASTASGRSISSIVQMLQGQKGFDKKQRAAYKANPIGYVNDLIEDLRYTPVQSLDKVGLARVDDIINRLQNVSNAWQEGKAEAFTLSDEDIAWLNTLK